MRRKVLATTSMMCGGMPHRVSLLSDGSIRHHHHTDEQKRRFLLLEELGGALPTCLQVRDVNSVLSRHGLYLSERFIAIAKRLADRKHVMFLIKQAKAEGGPGLAKRLRKNKLQLAVVFEIRDAKPQPKVYEPIKIEYPTWVPTYLARTINLRSIPISRRANVRTGLTRKRHKQLRSRTTHRRMRTFYLVRNRRGWVFKSLMPSR